MVINTERKVRRLFTANGLTVLSIRRGRHWIVTASKNGEEQTRRFVLPVSPSDQRAIRNIEADLKRDGY
jgi:uncharacterized protein with PhoU and TrkA domain